MNTTREKAEFLNEIYQYLGTDPKGVHSYKEMEKEFLRRGRDSESLYHYLGELMKIKHIEQYGNDYGLITAGRVYMNEGGILKEFEEEENNQKRLAILDNLNIKVLKWSIPIHIITILFTLCAIGISIWAIIESRK